MCDKPSLSQIQMFWQEILEVDSLSVDDNVFRRGASSLQVLRFVNRLQREFGSRLAIKEIYSNPTPAQLHERLTEDVISSACSAPALANIELPVLTSSSVQQLLFLEWEENPAYPQVYMTAAFLISGNLNVTALHESLKIVAGRHEALHCHFQMNGNQLERRLISDVEVPLSIFSPEAAWADLDENDISILMAERLFVESIDPKIAPNYRVHVCMLEERKAIILAAAHHIVLDRPGFAKWLMEVSEVYSNISLSRSLPEYKRCSQQSDYNTWQKEFLSESVRHRLMADLAQRMRGANFVLPFYESDGTSETPAIMRGFEKIHVAPAGVSALADLSVKEGVSKFAALTAVWNIVLYHYCGLRDIVIRVAGATRDRDEFAGIVGILWAPLYIRCRFDADTSFRQLMAHAQQAIINALDFQHLPIYDVWDALRPEIDLKCHPANFHFTLHREPIEERFNLEGLEVQSLSSKRGDLGADVKVHLHDHNDTLAGCLFYDSNRISAGLMQRLVVDFCAAVEMFGREPELHADAFVPTTLRA